MPCELEDPRLPEMVGIATLAMVESSTCMKVAMASATVIRGKLGAFKRFLWQDGLPRA